MTCTIEFNDVELSVYSGSERLYQAPAFAMVLEGELSFGEEALRLSRIHPQQANQQYLSRMNADPLLQPVRAAANHADLVYLHLKELARLCPADAVLAVPGTMNADQLGILLGICQEAGIDVSGFVIAPVAALSKTAVPGNVVYLDMFLQHLQASELHVDDEVRHERSLEVRDCGFSNLLDGWVNLVADRFVQETRFDPLHTAETEQQLYNQVYDWARGAHVDSEVGFEVLHAEQRRRVEIPRAALEQKTRQRVERLIDSLPDCRSLALSARVARMPGIAGSLKTAGYDLYPLAGDAVAAACREHMAFIRTADQGLRLISHLLHDGETWHDAQTEAEVPTHLLQANVARRPENTALSGVIHASEGGLWISAGSGASVNGEIVNKDRRLRPGDVISTASGTYTAIVLDG